MGPKLRYPLVYHLQAAPLLNAVATVGPIAITVDASAWSAYESGVFDGCSSTNIDLDHAVQLVGECVSVSMCPRLADSLCALKTCCTNMYFSQAMARTALRTTGWFATHGLL